MLHSFRNEHQLNEISGRKLSAKSHTFQVILGSPTEILVDGKWTYDYDGSIVETTAGKRVSEIGKFSLQFTDRKFDRNDLIELKGKFFRTGQKMHRRINIFAEDIEGEITVVRTARETYELIQANS